MQHPAADLNDQLAVLGGRQERRREQFFAGPFALRAPANQRLDADRLASRERQDRLVGEHQLLARQRLAQMRLELDLRAHRPAQAVVERLADGAA